MIYAWSHSFIGPITTANFTVEGEYSNQERLTEEAWKTDSIICFRRYQKHAYGLESACEHKIITKMK